MTERGSRRGGDKPGQRGDEEEAQGHRLRKGADIQDRTYRFAIRVVRLVDQMPRTVAGLEIGRQLVRSATSIGANVEEADVAESRRDFIHKMRIALKEGRETRYWLGILQGAVLDGDSPINRVELQALIQESEELVRILHAIVRNATRGMNPDGD